MKVFVVGDCNLNLHLASGYLMNALRKACESKNVVVVGDPAINQDFEVTRKLVEGLSKYEFKPIVRKAKGKVIRRK